MSPSAPALLLDLLGTYRADLPIGALCQAGNILGIGDTTVRVTLSRLVDEGKATRVRRGVYRIATGHSQLVTRVLSWQRQGDDAVPWSGDWLCVHDGAVRRSDKTAWRIHTRALQQFGFRQLAPGLQVRPNNRAGGFAQVGNELQKLGLAPNALVIHAAPFDEATQGRARELWDTQRLQREAENLKAELAASRLRITALPPDLAVRETLLLGRETIAWILRDPILPEELMDPGPRIELRQEMVSYQNLALSLWSEWLDTPDPA